MQGNIELYKKWTPEEGVWSPWVKPALFMNVTGGPIDLNIKLNPIDWLHTFEQNTMVIVDLPGEESIIEGLSLCRTGFRPVPLYNSVNPERNYVPVIPVEEIVSKLNWGARVIFESGLNPNSPPVFLLDSRRMTMSGSIVGRYDNRWCLLPQDMPSASFVKKQGIQRVIVRSNTLNNDLVHILKRYQDNGIVIFLCGNSDNQVNKYIIKKPSLFKSLAYRFSTIKGLTQNTAGGFGGFVPEPDESSGYMG